MLNGVNRIDKTCQPYLYRGEGCLERFVEQLSEIKEDMFSRMNVNIEMDISEEQELQFRQATRCSICNKTLNQMMKKSATTAFLKVSIEDLLT